MASLTAHLKLDRSGFAAGLKGAQKSINSFAKSARTAIGSAGTAAMWGVGIATTFATGTFAVGVKKALDLGGSLKDLADRTGLAAGSALVLQQAFKNAGIEADKLQPTINRLQKVIVAAEDGNKKARKAFRDIGIEWEDLSRLGPGEQFAQVATAIASLPDPAKRAAAAMAIFGKSGGELLSFFKDPSAITQAQREIGKAADVMNAKAPIFDDISDKIANMVPAKLSGLFIGVADSLSGPLLALLQRLEGTDLLSTGQAIGSSVIAAAQFTVDAFYTVRDTIMAAREGFAQMLVWAVEAVNFWFDGLYRANKIVERTWNFALWGSQLVLEQGAKLANLIWDGFTRSGNFLSATFHGTLALAKTLIASMAEGVAALALDMQTSFQFAFDAAARFFSSAMGPVIDAISAGLEFAIQNVMAGLAKIPILRDKLGLKGFQASSYEDILAGRTADRAARAAEPVRSYADRRAENYKSSGWMKSLMDFVGKTRESAGSSVAEGRLAMIRAFSPYQAQILDSDTFARAAAKSLEAAGKANAEATDPTRLNIINPALFAQNLATQRAQRLGTTALPRLGLPGLDKPSAPVSKPLSEWARLQASKFGDSTRARFGDSPSLLTHAQLGLAAGSRPGSYKLQGGLIGNSEAARKAEAERAAAVERDKDKTPEGTNTRLDELIGLVETAWG